MDGMLVEILLSTHHSLCPTENLIISQIYTTRLLTLISDLRICLS